MLVARPTTCCQMAACPRLSRAPPTRPTAPSPTACSGCTRAVAAARIAACRRRSGPLAPSATSSAWSGSSKTAPASCSKRFAALVEQLRSSRTYRPSEIAVANVALAGGLLPAGELRKLCYLVGRHVHVARGILSHRQVVYRCFYWLTGPCTAADIGGEITARAAGGCGVRGCHLHRVQAGGTTSLNNANAERKTKGWHAAIRGTNARGTDGCWNPDCCVDERT